MQRRAMAPIAMEKAKGRFSDTMENATRAAESANQKLRLMVGATRMGLRFVLIGQGWLPSGRARSLG